MTNVDQPNQSPEQLQRAETEAYLAERLEWINDAVEVMTGNREDDPAQTFLPPTEVRADAEEIALSEEQEAQLREVAGRFGIGTETDVCGTAKIRIKEGGKVWKIAAEAKIAADDETMIFAGSPYVKLDQDQADYMQRKYQVDLEGKSEYEAARTIAESQPGFVALEEDEVLPFGYDIDNQFGLVQEATEQLVKIGERNGQPVMLIRVDREIYQEGEEQKYRNQPKPADLMGFVSDVLAACGDETSPIGIDTSNTYPSRAVDTVRVALKAGTRVFDTGMYGRQTLIDLDGTPGKLNQIPGELRKLYDNLRDLQADLQ